MKFIDYAKISVKAGNGGRGIVSFHHEKYVPKGGPDGGNGGKGGDVIFRANPHLTTLLDFKYRRNYKAEDGKPGGTSNKTGRNGENKIILVPCGTVIKDAARGEILADLVEPGQEYIAAKGGHGGRGNAEFATPTNQAPRFAEEGQPGEEREILLELKVLADVGIVGFPNVGKSTLISVISAARPKIADYPFTTLVPNLGVVQIGENQSFVVADIPGLVEGASEGRGLGLQFLRHIERTKLLLFLIDANTDNPKRDFQILLNELKKYNRELLHKEKVIAFSKMDSVTEETQQKLMKTSFGKNYPRPIGISAITGFGIQKIKFLLWEKVQYIRHLELGFLQKVKV